MLGICVVQQPLPINRLSRAGRPHWASFDMVKHGVVALADTPLAELRAKRRHGRLVAPWSRLGVGFGLVWLTLTIATASLSRLAYSIVWPSAR
eukprot:scaffold86953_cov64-Phaeocystis_antarctica.AAC.2